MKSKTILVIDSDVQTSRLISKTLEAEGYLVFTASRGTVGLTMAKKINPSVIFLDLTTPDTNGLQICNDIHAIAALKEVPIVLLTEHEGAPEPRYQESYGIIDFIKKPVDASLLVSKAASAGGAGGAAADVADVAGGTAAAKPLDIPLTDEPEAEPKDDDILGADIIDAEAEPEGAGLAAMDTPEDPVFDLGGAGDEPFDTGDIGSMDEPFAGAAEGAGGPGEPGEQPPAPDVPEFGAGPDDEPFDPGLGGDEPSPGADDELSDEIAKIFDEPHDFGQPGGPGGPGQPGGAGGTGGPGGTGGTSGSGEPRVYNSNIMQDTIKSRLRRKAMVGGGKKSIFLLAALLVVALAGGGAYYFFFMPSKEAPPSSEKITFKPAPPKVAAPKPKAPTPPKVAAPKPKAPTPPKAAPKPKAPAPPKVAAKPPVTKPAAARPSFYVQVGAFKSRANADKMAMSLKAKGYDASSLMSMKKGVPLYRVVIGKFASSKAAAAKAREVRKKEKIGAVVYKQ